MKADSALDSLDPHGEPGTTAVIEVAAPTAPLRPAFSGVVLLALLTVYLVWGSTYLAIRYALAGYPPFFFPGVRFVVAGATLLLLSRLRGTPWPNRRQWRNAALIGFLLLIGGNGFVVLAERNVGSGLAATAVATVPLWAAVFGLFWGHPPNRVQWLGLAIGFIGIVVLNAGSEMTGNPLAALMLGIAALSWAYGSLLGRRLALPVGIANPGAQMLCAGLMFFALSALRGESWVLFPNAAAAWTLLYLIVFGSLIGFSAYIYLVHNTSPALATSYAYVNPVVAVLLGVLLGGEALAPGEIGAIVLVLAGVALIVAFNRPSPQAAKAR